MSNQILISSGAKLRDLDDVIIGTDGVLTSLGFNVANGVPKLDENGKILVSQLPNSVMEFKGVWNAATNTPTLADGTGNAGDVYLCNVAGTVNFGSGPIAFAVGDYAVYTGTVWARSSGATGTVTSVGVSRDGNALAITGSPITTSGTINLGFSGDNTQYINGAGNLTTFPTLITSIGLTMPAAFNVSNSPLTANGTIGVTAAGFPSQYIRGDGTLADFPTSGGGGSSVSYYLNGGTSQGTIGGTTYYEMSKTANTGTGADFSKSGNGLITAFLTDAGDPALLQIPAGNWNYEIYASMSANGGTPELYAELYVYNGTTFTLISTSTNEILYDGTNLNLYTFAMAVPETTLTVTDRLAIKLYSTNSGGKTTTVHTQNGHLCQVITTFTTGLTALNGLTAQVQYFGTGTSGSDFNIVSSVDTHTFNLPTASATKRGALSSADWSTFNGKQDFITAGTTLQYFRGDKTFQTLNTSVVPELTNLYFTDARARAAISLTTTGSSGASTYSNITGILNVPNYTLAGLGGVPTTRTLTINGDTYDLSANRTWTITAGISSVSGTAPISVSTVSGAATVSIATANTSTTGALTSTDWNSFNGKQNALTNPVTGTGLIYQIPYFSATGSAITGSNNFITDISGSLFFGYANSVSANYFNINHKDGVDGGFLLKRDNITSDWQIINDSTSGNLLFYSYGNSAYSLVLKKSNGNVLINTTTDGGFKFDVNGTGRFQGALSGTSATFSSSVTANGGFYLPAISFGSSPTFSYTNSISYGLSATGGNAGIYFGNQYNSSYATAMQLRVVDGGGTNISAMTITSNGNVGIGISSPTNLLHVAKDLSGEAIAFINNTSATGFGLAITAGGGTRYVLSLNDYANTPLARFLANGTIYFNTSTGVSGGGALQVNGNVNINGVFQINGVTIGGGGGSGVTGSGTTGYHSKWTGSTSLGNSVIYDNGTKASIGTTDMIGMLSINTNNTTAYNAGGFNGLASGISLQTGNATSAITAIRFCGGGNNEALFGTFQDSGGLANFIWQNYNGSNYGEIMRINSSTRNLLIGTSTDLGGGYKLQVNGSISMAYASFFNFKGSSGAGDILVDNSGSTLRVTGNFYVNGTVTSSGGFFDTSDARLKTLVEDNYLLSSIANVKAKLYKKDGRMELGYYAQDLLKILPSAVNEGKDGFLSLSYAQVHTAKIAIIEDEVTILKNRVSELETKLQKYDA